MKLSLALTIALACFNDNAFAFAPPHLGRSVSSKTTTALLSTKSPKGSKSVSRKTTPTFEDPVTYEGTQKEQLDQVIRHDDQQSSPPSSATAAAAAVPALPEVFKGIHLPPWDMTQGLGVLNEHTVKKVTDYVQKASVDNVGLFGQPKDNLDIARKVLADVANLGDDDAGKDDYRVFGNSNYEKQLVLLLQTNPFMASALTECKNGGKGGFELKSHDPNEKNPSLFLRILRTLNGNGHRVNFQFNDKMEIESYTVFDDTTGQELYVDDQERRQDYASSAIYNLMFYASAIHATIHVYHYLLTSGFMEETKHFEDLHKVAVEMYGKNIRNKYAQVGELLIKDPTPNPKDDKALITGIHGFGSSQAISPILQEVLNEWSQVTTADDFFLKNFMNISKKSMYNSNVLVEFRKHLDLVKPFARDLKRAMFRTDSTKYGTDFRLAQNGLKQYLKNCGTYNTTRVTLIQQWIELMSITGIIHGATMSYTRLFADPGIMKWRNINSATWDEYDINMITGTLGTVVGMEEGRHVMGSEFVEQPNVFADDIQEVLNNYDAKANKLKQEHKEHLLNDVDRDEFNNYGFILSDYGPDGFDGKQVTIATYI